jgi:hypothetical protein
LWTISTSSICRPTVISGFSAVIGSWKIIDSRSPRSRRRSAGLTRSRSRPSKSMTPSEARTFGSGSSPITARAVSDFPEPDSPTTHTISRSPTAKDTSSTA